MEELLQKKLCYKFKDASLLKTALTHSSYANETHGSYAQCNERLEFLGDSVLGMTVAEDLYARFPERPEGELTKIRADLVCEKNLGKVADELSLGRFLYLSHGEEKGGGRKRISILADAVEAIIAAMYLDGGKKETDAFIKKYILDTADFDKPLMVSDYKTALQELMQKENGRIISYNIVEEKGPDHDKEFITEVCVNGKRIGLGRGRSKKAAEQNAACNALAEMQN